MPDKAIKQRTIYVYLPSKEMVEDWKAKAREARTSVSKFIIHNVREALRQKEDPTYKAPEELIKDIAELAKENDVLREELRQKRMLVRRMDEDLRACRASLSRPFLEEGYKGERDYEARLVKILMERGFLTHDEVLEELGVKPGDVEISEAIGAQIEQLERYGLVRQTPKGMRWTG